MDRKILFESAGPIHGSQYNLINYPPKGYMFVTRHARERRLASQQLKTSTGQYILTRGAYYLPLGLIRSYLANLFEATDDVDLIYGFNHLVFKEMPWVVYVEWIHLLLSFCIKHLWRFHGIVEDAFSSDHCKAILTWSNVVRKNILHSLDCREFEDKIKVIYPGVPKREFVKPERSDAVKLLFVCSGQTPSADEFGMKGGKEVLKMFTILSKDDPNLKLSVRARVPREFRDMIKRNQNITLIEDVVPWDRIDYEFRTSDILVHPTQDPLNTVILDAMSYGLPIVVLDIYNYPEWVEDRVTGFLIRRPSDVPYYWKDFVPHSGTPVGPKHDEAIRSLHMSTVEQLVEKVGILIEDEPLREKMSRACRREVEQGRFSIETRNRELKKIFDEALQT